MQELFVSTLKTIKTQTYTKKGTPNRFQQALFLLKWIAVIKSNLLKDNKLCRVHFGGPFTVFLLISLVDLLRQGALQCIVQSSNCPILLLSNSPIILLYNHPIIQRSKHPIVQSSNCHPIIQIQLSSYHPIILSSKCTNIQSVNCPIVQ